MRQPSAQDGTHFLVQSNNPAWHGVGASGGGNLEELPGREEFGEDEDGAQNWAAAALQFAEENFNDDGAEVRSMDQRDLQGRAESVPDVLLVPGPVQGQ